jgi:hypothetical protein
LADQQQNRLDLYGDFANSLKLDRSGFAVSKLPSADGCVSVVKRGASDRRGGGDVYPVGKHRRPDDFGVGRLKLAGDTIRT